MSDAARAGGEAWVAAVRIARSAPAPAKGNPLGELAREWCLKANDEAQVPDVTRLATVPDAQINWIALGTAIRLYLERKSNGFDGCMGLCVTVATRVVDATEHVPTHSMTT